MALVEPIANSELANSNVMRSPSEPYSKERAKFEATHTDVGPGKRPYVFRPYPAMFYLAGKPEGVSKVTIMETLEVESREAEDFPRSRGFRPTPLEALQHYDDEQTEFMKLAGNLNYQVKNTLSEKAGAEVLAAMDQHSGHLPSVPVTPIAPRKKEKN